MQYINIIIGSSVRLYYAMLISTENNQNNNNNNNIAIRFTV